MSDVTIPGFVASGVAAGIKRTGALDLALIVSELPCAAAAVFTQNKFAAAPVEYDRHILTVNSDAMQAVLINSGCANACTGVEGLANARRMAELAEQALGLPPTACLVMSTGVIGVQLPLEKLLRGVPDAVNALAADGLDRAAAAIMTTDTRPKTARGQFTLASGETVHLWGMAKGAGMIHPNMATMLSVVLTDAAITPAALDRALRHAVDRSFNAVTVDGDTSTNDTLAVLANGAAGNASLTPDSADFMAFQHALTTVCLSLAQQIVRDGEGATKFAAITVSGAASDADARLAAKAVAHSPLVKTALYGGDANWGRILAAVGYSGAQVDPDRVALHFGSAAFNLTPLQVVAAGQPLPYDEAAATARFTQPEIEVLIELGLGAGQATVWTCDLSHAYVDINGHYRT
ncbi:MAG: bifunctional glutamate N-acetyltransferase/amino-acid acetyltransferase ArgJ [Anaerolineae bacterium]